jgi:WD40 repeat protein
MPDDNQVYPIMHYNQKMFVGIQMMVIFIIHFIYKNHFLDTCFATASGTSGYLYIWDATRLVIINQLNIHNAIINRLQFHPTGSPLKYSD